MSIRNILQPTRSLYGWKDMARTVFFFKCFWWRFWWCFWLDLGIWPVFYLLHKVDMKYWSLHEQCHKNPSSIMGDRAADTPTQTHVHTHTHTQTHTHAHTKGKNNSLANPFGDRLITSSVVNDSHKLSFYISSQCTK